MIALAHKEATFGSDPDEISLSSQEEHSQESFTIKSKEKTNGKWSKLPQRLKIVSPGKARLRNYQRTSFEKFDSNDRPLSTTNSSWSDQNSSQHSVLQSMSTNKPHSLRRRRKTANMDGSVSFISLFPYYYYYSFSKGWRDRKDRKGEREGDLLLILSYVFTKDVSHKSI